MRLIIVILILLLPMVLTFLAIRDVVHRPFDDLQKKMIWLLIIIFLPVLGGLIYFAFKKFRKIADKIS
ncbi:MAG: PLD nuclease N-terminal domain-containing protein [Deltaproteobacteria bacterium]|nr:PLD nuclease N-terminal domain-containing protein [Deltaproteobacteria bacterium]